MDFVFEIVLEYRLLKRLSEIFVTRLLSRRSKNDEVHICHPFGRVGRVGRAGLLAARIPPLTVFYYDPEQTQVSHDGKIWTMAPTPLFALPTYHAVVVLGVEKVRINSAQSELYVIFRDSANAGTDQKPDASYIRIRASQASELIKQVLSVQGPWDPQVN